MSKIDKLIKKHLPDTFYAGLSSEKRLKMLVDSWRRAMIIINKMEEERNKRDQNDLYMDS